jgi:hypothetical protein
MTTTKQQKTIDFMFCRVEKEAISCSTRSSSPFKGDTIAYSREGNNTATFQETYWKATKTNAQP